MKALAKFLEKYAGKIGEDEKKLAETLFTEGKKSQDMWAVGSFLKKHANSDHERRYIDMIYKPRDMGHYGKSDKARYDLNKSIADTTPKSEDWGEKAYGLTEGIDDLLMDALRKAKKSGVDPSEF